MDKVSTRGKANPPIAGGLLELAAYFYAAIYGKETKDSRPMISSREPAMRSKGLDPNAFPQSDTEPGFAIRRAFKQIDAGLGRSLRAQFAGLAHPLCQIEFNSSVAELRSAVEAMGLVLTSSKYYEVVQAIDVRQGGSLQDDTFLIQREEDALLERCIFCVDKKIPRPALARLVAVMEDLAAAKNSKVHYFTNDPGLSRGSCMGHAGEDPCASVDFDPCKPKSIYEWAQNQSIYTDAQQTTVSSIPVFIGNGSDIKQIEASYTKEIASRNRTVVTIREWGIVDPQPDCRVHPSSSSFSASPSTEAIVGVSLASIATLGVLGLAVCAIKNPGDCAGPSANCWPKPAQPAPTETTTEVKLED